MYCEECAQTLSPDAYVCINCGLKIPGRTPPAPVPAPAPSAAPSAPPPPALSEQERADALRRQPELERFKFWNRAGIAAFLAALPATGIALYATANDRRTLFIAALCASAPCAAATFVALGRLMAFRCPQCGELFMRGVNKKSGEDGGCCSHCGLNAYAPAPK